MLSTQGVILRSEILQVSELMGGNLMFLKLRD